MDYWIIQLRGHEQGVRFYTARGKNVTNDANKAKRFPEKTVAEIFLNENIKTKSTWWPEAKVVMYNHVGSKPKVEIRNTRRITGWDSYESVEIVVDGEVVSSGGYGGEPEDNCRGRDYWWVEHALQTLAEKLGAEVTVTENEVERED